MIRVCVVGCGAIGGIYAAHLAQLGEVEVWAYDVSPDHVAAIERDGLRLNGAVELVGAVQARTDATEIPACRYGLVATKGTATEAAAQATARVFAGAGVCSVQNGIGNEEVIAAHVAHVMRGVTLPAGRVTAPGVIEVDALGPTWIGPFEPRPAPFADVEELGDLIAAGGLPTHVMVDARGPQWTKLVFNAATNPLCALTGLTHAQLCAHPPTRALAARLVAEGRAVADAMGIMLDSDPDELIDEAARVNPHHRPSMLQDVEAHRRTEIATLNGGIVAAAASVGLRVPLHEAVCDLVGGLEHSWSVSPAQPGSAPRL
jgi:2-dehydropantoate 2-reductase